MQLNCRPFGLCVLVACMMALFLWLGTWQLDRADLKTEILEQSRNLSSKAVVSLELDRAEYESIRYSQVSVAGRYDIQHQLFLDNQVKHRKVGYNVLTPVKISGSNKAVLVDRGWVPQGQTRQLRPDIKFTQVNDLIVGSLYSPFGKGVRLGGLDDGEFLWPRVIQFLDFEAISERLGYHLLPVIIRLSPDAENGYLREWKTVSFSPDKHLGYAVQWFGLAIAMLVILIVLVIKKDE